MHYDTTELESARILASGVQEFVVQVGVHNFCNVWSANESRKASKPS